MSTNNPTLDPDAIREKYTYDQLNRLLSSTSDIGYSTAYRYDKNGNIEHLDRKGKSDLTIVDDLSYGYEKKGRESFARNTNKLLEVKEGLGSDLGLPKGQVDHNYEYDEIGQLKKDEQEGIASIVWSVYTSH